MQELMCFNAFLYQYIESIMFLEVARRGGAIAPLAPPKSATEYCSNVAYICIIYVYIASIKREVYTFMML